MNSTPTTSLKAAMIDLPPVALSIMQPWAALIVAGVKDIENRTWSTRFRGPVAIHAGARLDREASQSIRERRHPVTGESWPNIPDYLGARPGGIVGVAEIVDCVEQSESSWFVGRYGFVLRNAKPVSFLPLRGSLGFFNWKNDLTRLVHVPDPAPSPTIHLAIRDGEQSALPF